MPCTYEETPDEIAARRTKEIEAIIAPYKAAADEATRLLCGLFTAIEPIMTQPAPKPFPKNKGRESEPLRIRGVNGNGGVTIDLGPELCGWWRKHQRLDAARKKQELRNTALAKLTPEERDALDLNDDA